MATYKSFIIYILLLVSNFSYSQSSLLTRDKLKEIYTSQIGVRELTGKNDGVQVERYLKYVWLKRGQPWCASYVSWCFGQVGIKHARSGGCVVLMEQGVTIYRGGKILKNKPPPTYGDVFFIWYANKNRVAHTGFIDKWTETWITTVEGNTNEAGSREGDGVYRKKRLKRQIYSVTTYL